MGLKSFWVMKYEAKAWSDQNQDQAVDVNSEVDADGLSVNLLSSQPVSVAEGLPWREISASNSANECESKGPGFDITSNKEWMALARDIEQQDLNWSSGNVGAGCIFQRNNDSDPVCGYDGENPEGGSNRDMRASFILSNGEVIFDLAGNVRERVE